MVYKNHSYQNEKLVRKPKNSQSGLNKKSFSYDHQTQTWVEVSSENTNSRLVNSNQIQNSAYSQNSASQNPAYQNPAYQNPAYQNPTYQNPTYQNPTYQNPTYQNSVYTEQNLQSLNSITHQPKNKFYLISFIQNFSKTLFCFFQNHPFVSGMLVGHLVSVISILVVIVQMNDFFLKLLGYDVIF